MTILLVCAFAVTTSDMAECLTSSKEKRNLRAGSVGNTPPVNFCEIFLNGERACGHDSGKILKSRVKRARGTNFKNYFKKKFFEEHKNTVIFLIKTVKNMQIIHKKQTYFEKKGGERIDKNGNKRFSGQAVGASGNECRVLQRYD